MSGAAQADLVHRPTRWRRWDGEHGTRPRTTGPSRCSATPRCGTATRSTPRIGGDLQPDRTSSPTSSTRPTSRASRPTASSSVTSSTVLAARRRSGQSRRWHHRSGHVLHVAAVRELVDRLLDRPGQARHERRRTSVSCSMCRTSTGSLPTTPSGQASFVSDAVEDRQFPAVGGDSEPGLPGGVRSGDDHGPGEQECARSLPKSNRPRPSRISRNSVTVVASGDTAPDALQEFRDRPEWHGLDAWILCREFAERLIVEAQAAHARGVPRPGRSRGRLAVHLDCRQRCHVRRGGHRPNRSGRVGGGGTIAPGHRHRTGRHAGHDRRSAAPGRGGPAAPAPLRAGCPQRAEEGSRCHRPWSSPFRRCGGPDPPGAGAPRRRHHARSPRPHPTRPSRRRHPPPRIGPPGAAPDG